MPPAYFQHLASLLEPLAIEPRQRGIFAYSVPAGVAKWLLASYNTTLAAGGGGRWELRDPGRGPLSLAGLTLRGLAADAAAVVLDPMLPVYASPYDTYYDRLNALATMTPQHIDVTGTGQLAPLLPGAYGAIVQAATAFDLAWLILRMGQPGPVGPGINLWNEQNDTAPFRWGDRVRLPISKYVVSEVESGAGGAGARGGISYWLLPASWGAVADPLSPTDAFRDDFMGAALDPAIWARIQSAPGNVEINRLYQWCRLAGNGSWNTNSAHTLAGLARAAGKSYVWDVYLSRDPSTSLMVGLSDGAGQDYTNLAHAVDTTSSPLQLKVYEHGLDRGVVGSGVTLGGLYRIRITPHPADQGATYEIQGGPEYPVLGGLAWTTITPAVTSSPTSMFYPAFTVFAGMAYVGDVRAYP